MDTVDAERTSWPPKWRADAPVGEAARRPSGQSLEQHSQLPSGQPSAQLALQSTIAGSGDALLHVFSVATKRTPRVSIFLKQCRFWGFNCTILGEGMNWAPSPSNWDPLMDAYVAALRQLPASALVITGDAQDVFIQAEPARAAAEYDVAAPGRRVLACLETHCPREGECANLTTSNAAGIAGLSHLNGGFLMGPAAKVAAMWESARGGDPQINLGRFAAANPDMVSVDVAQQVCATVSRFESVPDHDYYELVSIPERRAFGLHVRKTLRNTHTKRSPCFVHCPGTQERLRQTKKKARLIFYDLLQGALLPVPS